MTVDDWGKEIFAEGVGVKWKKMGKWGGVGVFFSPSNPYPTSAPTLYWSSIQLQSKMAASNRFNYLAFRLEITPALQANQMHLQLNTNWHAIDMLISTWPTLSQCLDQQLDKCWPTHMYQLALDCMSAKISWHQVSIEYQPRCQSSIDWVSIRQGLDGSWNTWKVLEFSGIFRD